MIINHSSINLVVFCITNMKWNDQILNDYFLWNLLLVWFSFQLQIHQIHFYLLRWINIQLSLAYASLTHTVKLRISIRNIIVYCITQCFYCNLRTKKKYLIQSLKFSCFQVSWHEPTDSCSIRSYRKYTLTMFNSISCLYSKDDQHHPIKYDALSN